jgi:hypothetical protein
MVSDQLQRYVGATVNDEARQKFEGHNTVLAFATMAVLIVYMSRKISI